MKKFNVFIVILVTYMFLFPNISVSQEINGTYEVFRKGHNGKETILIFLYKKGADVFAKKQVYRGKNTKKEPISQCYFAGMKNLNSDGIEFASIDKYTRDFRIGSCIRKFTGEISSSNNKIEITYGYMIEGLSLQMTNEYQSKFKEFQKEIESVRRKVIYRRDGTGKRNYVNRAIPSFLKGGNEWMKIGDEPRPYDMLIANYENWCTSDTLHAMFVGTEQSVKKIFDNVKVYLHLGHEMQNLARFCPRTKYMKIYRGYRAYNTRWGDPNKYFIEDSVLIEGSISLNSSLKYRLDLAITKNAIAQQEATDEKLKRDCLENHKKPIIIHKAIFKNGEFKADVYSNDKITVTKKNAWQKLPGKTFLFKSFDNIKCNLVFSKNGSKVIELKSNSSDTVELRYENAQHGDCNYPGVDFYIKANYNFSIYKPFEEKGIIKTFTVMKHGDKLILVELKKDYDYGMDMFFAIGELIEINPLNLSSYNNEITDDSFGLHTVVMQEGIINPSKKLLNFSSWVPPIENLIKNIYYGRFEEVNKADFFNRYHNSFLYFTSDEYGKDYVNNAKEVTYSVKETTKNGFGVVTGTNIVTYKIWMQPRFEKKFRETVSTSQFTFGNALGWGNAILEILDRYEPNDIVFKQLLENTYRYSVGLPPTAKIEELENK